MDSSYRYKDKRSSFEKGSLSDMQAFFMEKVSLLKLISKWHYHEENEIVFIINGRGTGFIGDGQFTFSEGTLIMVGALTPHVWLINNETLTSNPKYEAEAIVIKFRESFLSKNFIQFAGVERVNALFEKAKHGMLFTGDNIQPVKNKLKTFSKLDNFDKILLLLEILNAFSKSPACTLVSSSISLSANQRNELSNIDKILKFVDANFKHKITIEEVAEIANLSPTSFCRYFKSRTFKTFVTAVNEIRIEYACKLLLETNFSVSEISYQSGFNQLSNFYRQFVNIKKITPIQFRKSILAG